MCVCKARFFSHSSPWDTNRHHPCIVLEQEVTWCLTQCPLFLLGVFHFLKETSQWSRTHARTSSCRSRVLHHVSYNIPDSLSLRPGTLRKYADLTASTQGSCSFHPMSVFKPEVPLNSIGNDGSCDHSWLWETQPWSVG